MEWVHEILWCKIMFDLKKAGMDIYNSIIENEENAKIFKNELENAKNIIISGDDTLSSVLSYTFYLLASEKKVLVTKSSQVTSKLNYDLLIEFKRMVRESYVLKILLKKDDYVKELSIKSPGLLSQSTLLPFLTMLTNLTNGSNEKKVFINKIVEGLSAIRDTIPQVKRDLMEFGHCFCLGRSTGFAIAQDICTILTTGLGIHAESYPAGESKHGPIALIETGFPVIQIIDDAKYRKKMINSIMEMKARGAKIISITHLSSEDIQSLSNYTLRINDSEVKESALIHIPYILIALAISNL